MAQWIQPLGILVAVLYGLSVCNGLFKFMLKRRLLEPLEVRVDLAGRLRRWIMRHHRKFGVLTLFALIAHVSVAVTVLGGISVTGALAEANMLLVIGLGIYGQYVGVQRGNDKWRGVHGMLAWLEIVLIALHILAPYMWVIWLK